MTKDEELAEHIQELANYCAREGMELSVVRIRKRMSPSFMVATHGSFVSVTFTDYERAIEDQRNKAATEDFERRHANCSPPCHLCNLKAVLEKFKT